MIFGQIIVQMPSVAVIYFGFFHKGDTNTPSSEPYTWLVLARKPTS
jgi:hypothetical protein